MGERGHGVEHCLHRQTDAATATLCPALEAWAFVCEGGAERRTGVDALRRSGIPEDETHAIEAARAINDLYADLVQRYPTRFAAFAATPLPHIDAALVEMERALDQLHMAGVTMATSILGRSPADPEFEPLYAELDR
jgi:predicted TIM-barrel fold metal-dependent hydrolase